MSNNQQEQSPPASSGDQDIPSSHSKKKKKEIKYRVRTLDIPLGELDRYEHLAWSSFFMALASDPRWISRTGYNPHSRLPPFNHQRHQNEAKIRFMYGDTLFVKEEAEEKSKDALDILTALGFRNTTPPGTLNNFMVWGRPSLEKIKENLPTLDLDVTEVERYCRFYQRGEFLCPDVSWLEHIKWERGAEVEKKMEGDTVDGKEEEASRKVPLNG